MCMHDHRRARRAASAFAAALALSACGGGDGGGKPATDTLGISIVGEGSVVSDPAGNACGVECSKAYAEVTVVTLLPFADAGQSFSGCSGAADCGDGRVTMNVAVTCTATFRPTGGTHISASHDFSVARTRSGTTSRWGSDVAEALGNGAALGDHPAPAATASAAAAGHAPSPLPCATRWGRRSAALWPPPLAQGTRWCCLPTAMCWPLA